MTLLQSRWLWTAHLLERPSPPPIRFINFALLFSVSRRNSDPASHSSTQQALPPWWGPVFQILILCYEKKAEIVQTNRKLRVRNTAQNGQHEKWSKAALEMSIYLALLHVVLINRKWERLQPFDGVVVMKTAAMHMLTVHSFQQQCHLPCWTI